MALSITASRPDPALLDLPWDLPLETWPEDHLAALPRGISRHVVRFVKRSGRVLAVKEIKADIAVREYQMLRMLGKLDLPCVVPFGIVSGREAADGPPLDACLLTRHLQFSLPYRALFSQSLRPDSSTRWRCCSAGCTSSGAGGGTCRCPTRCSGATPARSRHTSSTPRPVS